MRGLRIAFVSGVFTTLGACGLGVSGTQEAPVGDAGPDASLPEAAGNDASDGGGDAPADGLLADVLPDVLPDVVVDAGGDGGCVQSACAALGGTCSGGACQRSCVMNQQCTGVMCPAGMPCEITCQNDNACNNIDCGLATTCTVHCNNANACIGGVTLRGTSGSLNGTGANAATAPVVCCADHCTMSCPGNDCTAGVCCKNTSAATCSVSGGPTATTCNIAQCP